MRHAAHSPYACHLLRCHYHCSSLIIVYVCVSMYGSAFFLSNTNNNESYNSQIVTVLLLLVVVSVATTRALVGWWKLMFSIMSVCLYVCILSVSDICRPGAKNERYSFVYSLHSFIFCSLINNVLLLLAGRECWH